jgi:hypothetical protein
VEDSFSFLSFFQILIIFVGVLLEVDA